MGGTILLAEDNETFRTVLTRVLEQAGYTVLPAQSVADALVIMQSAHVDLAIADVAIPGREDLSLLHRLWALSAAVPLIYMSGYPREYVEDEYALRRGASFIAKPFSIPDLLANVRELLESRG